MAFPSKTKIGLTLVVVVAITTSAFALVALDADDRFAVMTVGLLCGTGLAVFLGPQLTTSDLRDDLPNLEILRSWPLSGRQIVTGEVLAPILLLGAVIVALVVAGTAASLQTELGGINAGQKVVLGLMAALVGPPLAGLGVAVQNGAALLFPTWVATGQRRGIEAVGQRLLTLLGSVLVLLVGLFPAAAAGAVVGGLLFGLLGPSAGVPGAAITGLALLGQLYLVLGGVGRVFDAIDLGRE